MKFTAFIKYDDFKHIHIPGDDYAFGELDFTFNLKEGECHVEDVDADLVDGADVVISWFIHDGFMYQFLAGTLDRYGVRIREYIINRWIIDDMDDNNHFTIGDRSLPVVCPDLIAKIEDMMDDALIEKPIVAELKTAA